MTPTATSPKATKKQQSAAEKLNARVLKIGEFAAATQKLMVVALGQSIEGTSSRVALEAAIHDLETIAEAGKNLSTSLLRLHKEKWAPRTRLNDFVPGQPVAVRDRYVPRFAGAWDKADLKSLRVVSLHGNRAKVEIHRDGLNGGCVGLVQTHWMQPRAS